MKNKFPLNLPLSKQVLMASMVLVVLAGCGAAYWFFFRGDSPVNIKKSEMNLQVIGRALKNFQSESYFGKIPSSLEDLYSCRLEFYVPNAATENDNTFSRIDKTYSMIPDMMIFRSPTDSASSDKLRVDYTLLKWYEMFMPDNTVIAWDNPGNFQSGGNVLFYDGTVRFYAMNSGEYRRFIEGVQSRNDREFLRTKCADMSLKGFSDIHKSGDEEAQKILDQASGVEGGNK